MSMKMPTAGQALLLVGGAFLLGARGAAGLSAADWRKQSIYQVLTDRFARTDLSTTASCDVNNYCGGTWQGLISKLDYIQGMGFTAIWISPVVEQISGASSDGSSYHGYWAQDIWTVNSAFGSESDLIALSAALHNRGMYLMVDVVTNHMGYMGCGTCVGYSKYNPFSSSSYFHPYCAMDYNNETSIKVCWEGDNTVSLPDLRTEDSTVRNLWNNWITNMVSTYSIDGLRVDSVRQVEMSFWSGFASAAGVYMVGEIYDGDPSYVAPYQNYISGVLDYPSYFWILQAFESTSGSISNLVNGMSTLTSDAVDLSLYGSFIENHDVPRFPSYNEDMSLVKNAIAFTMLKDGIPIIYQGQEQHFSGGSVPNNREALWTSGYSTSAELYAWIATLNKLRTRAVAQDSGYTTSRASVIYSDSHSIAVRKGDTGYQVVGVYSNVGSSSSASVTLNSSTSGFTANEALVDVMSCATYTTDSSGSLTVSLASGLPRVLYPVARLSGSGICSSVTGTTTATTTTTSTSRASAASDPTTSSPSSTSCSSTSVSITFDELVTTAYGDTIKITGNTTALGNWTPTSGVALSASQYTSSNPLWSGSVQLTPGAVILYKFVKVSSSGTVTWESDPDRSYTVPCATATVSDTWR